MAGVSVTTASAALSGSGRVSAATAQRVRQAAAELGYRASHAARAMRAPAAPVVGVVLDVPTIALDSDEHPALWWPRVLLSLVEELGREGVVVSCISAESPAIHTPLSLDALVTIERPGGNAVLPDDLPYGVPVFLGGDAERSARPASRVAPSYADAARTALDHLADGGAQRPGLLTVAPRISHARHLEAGYEAWCLERGLEPVVVGRAGGSPAVCADALVDAGCDAVLSVSNASASILAALRRRGRVPEDISLVVLAEGLVEQHLDPPVTTLSFDGTAAGRDVATAVLDALRSGTARDVLIGHTLCPRGSSLGRAAGSRTGAG